MILTDDSAGREATVRFTTDTGDPLVPKSLDTRLPLALDFLPQSPTDGNSRILRIRVREPLTGDLAGQIHVRLSNGSESIKPISISVIILREGIAHLQVTEKP